jgi:hypothetical protein
MRKAILGANQSRFLSYFYNNVTVRKSVLGTSRSCFFFSSPKNMTADKRNILTEKNNAPSVYYRRRRPAGQDISHVRCVLGAFVERCAGDRRSHFVSKSQKQ